MSLNTSAPIQSGEYLTNSPAEALLHILSLKLSGRLTIYDPNDRSISWRLYLSKGDIHFAHSMMGYHERLSYVLQQNQFELDLEQLDQFSSDYTFLCHCWKSGFLSLQQLRKLLLLLTQEALIQILALPQPKVQFEYLVKLDPILLSMPLEHIALSDSHLITQWQGLWPVVGSPFQRPFICDQTQFLESPEFKYPNEHLKQKLFRVLSRNLSLYSVSQHLKMSLTEVAHLLSPFVRSGSVAFKSYVFQEAHERLALTRPKLQEYHLLLIRCGQQNLVITLEATNYSIGRDRNNDIVLNHRSISRQHASLIKIQIAQSRGCQYRIVDGNAQGKPSTNGVFINDQQCQTHELVSGDMIGLGPEIQATYEKVSMDRTEFQQYLESKGSQSIEPEKFKPIEAVVRSKDNSPVDADGNLTVLSSAIPRS